MNEGPVQVQGTKAKHQPLNPQPTEDLVAIVSGVEASPISLAVLEVSLVL